MSHDNSGIIISESEASRSTMLLEEKRMNLQAGLLGKLFGSKENAPTNIAGFVLGLYIAVLTFIVILQVMGYATVTEETKGLLAIFTSIASMVFGYMFGRNSQN